MERLSITHGMSVVDPKGRTLGIVEICGSEHFLLRRGFFHPTHFAARYQDVSSLEAGSVQLREGEANLLDPKQPDLTSGIRMGVLPFQRSLVGASGH